MTLTTTSALFLDKASLYPDDLDFSALDEVSIDIDDKNFKIIEYVNLGLQDSKKYYQLEQTIIKFEDNAQYNIETKLLFEPPQFDKKVLHHIYNTNRYPG